MPETPIYGWPYEHPVLDEPGITLHGGALGQGRILAEEIEATVAALAGTVSGQQDALGALNAVAAQTIAVIDSGAGTNTTEFTNIPQTFAHLLLLWAGTHDGGDSVVSLGLRFNGDGGGTSYVSQRIVTRDNTMALTTGEFGIIRAGIVGRFTGSGGVIYIPHYSATGGQKSAIGDSYGRDLVGGEYRGWGHGRWQGTAPITAIRIWPSGQLWGSTPHLTLLGIRGEAS